MARSGEIYDHTKSGQLCWRKKMDQNWTDNDDNKDNYKI